MENGADDKLATPQPRGLIDLNHFKVEGESEEILTNESGCGICPGRCRQRMSLKRLRIRSSTRAESKQARPVTLFSLCLVELQGTRAAPKVLELFTRVNHIKSTKTFGTSSSILLVLYCESRHSATL